MLWCWVLIMSGASASDTVSLSAMTEFEGERLVDRDQLGQTVRQLARELGTAIAAQPGPAATPGADSFEVGVHVGYVATEGRLRGNEPSPWAQAHPNEDNAPWLGLPGISIRKGLPFSTEVGAHFGWIVGSKTGTAGVWGRAALVEGFRKLPDVSVRLGYTGYVGNAELDLGVLEAGATLGGRRPLSRLPGIAHGRASYWVDVSILRTSSRAQVSDALAVELGATNLEPLTVARVAAGLRVQSGPAFFQFGVSWAPATIPVGTTAFGVSL